MGDEAKRGVAQNRILFVVAHGRGQALLHSADDGTREFLQETLGSSDVDTFDFESAGVDVDYQNLSGVYVGEMRVRSERCGEHGIDVDAWVEIPAGTVKLATKEQWDAHLEGEWPW